MDIGLDDTEESSESGTDSAGMDTFATITNRGLGIGFSLRFHTDKMTTHPSKPEAQTPVLFDEDYRSFVWRLMEALDAERAIVWDLREEVRRLREQIAK